MKGLSGENSNGWIDVSTYGAQHGLPGRVEISNAAWMMAVYFVSETADRNDPAREGWRLGRLLVELAVALSRHRDRNRGQAREFELELPQAFDALRGLTLPCALLQVRVESGNPCPMLRIDVAASRWRRPQLQPAKIAA